jgi:hypothetical protein
VPLRREAEIVADLKRAAVGNLRSAHCAPAVETWKADDRPTEQLSPALSIVIEPASGQPPFVCEDSPMGADQPPQALEVSELSAADLQPERGALVELSRAVAAAGGTPGFARGGPDVWLGWHWDEVIAQAHRSEVRIFVARVADELVGAVEMRRLRAAGWGGWEPWKREEITNLIVHPGSARGVEAALLAFALSRSLVDFVVIEALPGGRVQQAAEGLGFRVAARVADLLVGPDGAPVEAAILTRSHATPSVIRPDLLAQVEAVTPSTDGRLLYRPCRVTLGDGRVVDRVYVQEAWTWKGTWGMWPEDYRVKVSISIDDVVRIEESPSRIAPDLANRVLAAGETSMGGTRFTLVLRDGRRVNVSTGNAVDFPGLPDGVVAGDVVDVILYEHAGTTDAAMPDPAYWWCLYSLPVERR